MALKATQYIKNLGKSMIYSTLDVTGDYLPAGKDLVQTNNDILKEAYTTIRSPKSSVKRLMDSIQNSKLYEAAELGFKATFEDIKTGNFYNKERIDQINVRAGGSLFEDSSDFGDIDFPDFNFEDDEDEITKGDSYIGVMVQASSQSSAEAISKTVAQSSKYIAQTQKTSTMMMYNLNIKGFEMMNSGITSVNENISKLLQFSTNTIKDYMEKSLKNDETLIKSIQEQTAMMRELYQGSINQNKRQSSKRRLSDITDASGNIDLKAYSKLVTKNFLRVSNLGSIFDLNKAIDDDANIFLTMAASPLSFISKGVIKGLISKDLEKSMIRFNDSLSNFFGSALFRMTSKRKYGENNSFIFDKIAEILGIDTSMKTSIDRSKYNKGPTPFDGMTKKAIVEVIPAYLARIESAITGASERLMDYNTGKWTDRKSVREQLKRRKDSLMRSEYGDMADLFHQYSDTIRFENLSDKDNLEKDIERFFKVMITKGMSFDPSTSTASDFGFNSYESQKNFELIKRMWLRSPTGMRMAIDNRLLKSRDKINDFMTDLEEQNYSIFHSLYDGSEVYSKYDKKGRLDNSGLIKESMRIANQQDEYGHNIFFYLRNQLQELMNISGGRGGSRKVSDASQRFIEKIGNKVNKSISEKDKIEYQTRNKQYQSTLPNFDKRIQNKGLYTINYDDLNDDDFVKAGINFGMVNQSNKEYEESEKNRMTWYDELFGYDYNGKKTVFGKIKDYGQKPSLVLAKVFDMADRRLYEILFGGPNALTKIDGQPVRGFVQAMVYKMNQQFEKLSNWFDEVFFKDLKKKFDAETLGGAINNMFKKFFGYSLTEIGNKVKESLFGVKDESGNITKPGLFTDVLQTTKDTFKGVFNWVKQGFKDVFSPVTDLFKNPFASDEKVVYKDDIESHYRGARFIDKTGLAVLSEGEMVIPQHLNPYYKGKKSSMSSLKRKEDKVLYNLAGKVGNKIDSFASGERSYSPTQFYDHLNIQWRKEYEKDYSKEEWNNLSVQQRKNYVAKVKYNKVPDNTEVFRRTGETITNSFKSVWNALIGNEETIEKNKEKIIDSSAELLDKAMKELGGDVKGYGSKAFAGGLVGGLGLPLITGGIVSPMMGAAIGSSISLTKSSKRLQDWLFGVEDKETGEFKNGVFPQKLSKAIKKYAPDMAKYGVVGAITAMMPFIPGGPVAGLMIGSSIGFVKNNTEIQKTLFGEVFTEENKAKIRDKVVKMLPKAIAGAAGGLILGGPFGLFGNMVLGGGLGILAGTDKVQELLFGPEIDGKRTGGIIREIGEKTVDPLKRAVKPIAKQFQIMGKSVIDTVGKAINKFFTDTIGIPIKRQIEDKIINPISNTIVSIFRAVFEPAKGLIGLPFQGIGAIGDSLRKRQILTGNADYMTAGQRLSWMKEHNVLKSGYSNFDKLIYNMDAKSLKEMTSTLSLLQEQNAIAKGNYRSAKRALGSELSAAMPSSEGFNSRDVAHLAKLIQQGNGAKAESYIHSLKIPETEKKKLIGIMQDKGALFLQSDKKRKEAENNINDLRAKLRKQGIMIENYDDNYLSKLIKYGQNELKLKEKDDNSKIVSPELKNQNKIISIIEDIRNKIVYDRVPRQIRSPRGTVSFEKSKLNKSIPKIRETMDGLVYTTTDSQGEEKIDMANKKNSVVLKAKEMRQKAYENINSHFPKIGGFFEKFFGKKEEKEEKTDWKKLILGALSGLSIIGFMSSGDAQKATSNVRSFLQYSDNEEGEREFRDNMIKAGMMLKSHGLQYGGLLRKIPLMGRILGPVGSTILDAPVELLARSPLGGTFFGEQGVHNITNLPGARSIFEEGAMRKFLATGNINGMSKKTVEELFQKGLLNLDEATIKSLPEATQKELLKKGLLTKTETGLVANAKGIKSVKNMAFKSGYLGSLSSDTILKLLGENTEKLSAEAAEELARAGYKSGGAFTASKELIAKLGNTKAGKATIGRFAESAATSKAVVKGTAESITKTIIHLFEKMCTSSRVAKYLGGFGAKIASLIPKLANMLMIRLPKLGAKNLAKLSGKLMVKGLSTPVFMAIGFVSGYTDPNRILGINGEATTNERVIAGLVRGLNQILLGIIPENVLVNLFFKHFGEGTDLAAKRAEAEEELARYNEENNTSLTLKEYQEEVLGQGGTFASRLSKAIGEKIEAGIAKVSQFFSDKEFRAQVITTVKKGLGKLWGGITDLASFLLQPIKDTIGYGLGIKEGDYWDISSSHESGEGLAANVKDLFTLAARLTLAPAYYTLRGVRCLFDKAVDTLVGFGKGVADIISPAAEAIKLVFVEDDEPEKGFKNFWSDLKDGPEKNSGFTGLLKYGVKVISRMLLSPMYILFTPLRKIITAMVDKLDWFTEKFGWLAEKLGLKEEEIEDIGSNSKKDKSKKTSSSKSSSSKKKSKKDAKGSGLPRLAIGGGSDSPILSQVDERIANMKFGNSTIGESGCAPSAAAMFLNNTYKDIEITDTMKYAKDYQTSSGSVDARYFSRVFGKYGYKANYTDNQKDITNRLKSGEQLILLGTSPSNTSKDYSPFGPSGHYIVANEITNDGRVLVNDPETGIQRYYDSSILNNVQLGVGVSKNKNMAVSKIKGFIGRGNENNANRQAIYEFLINEMGMNTAAACGILANIKNESGYRSGAEGDIGYSGGNSIGICQWREGRLTNLKNFCKENKLDYKSLYGQCCFLKYELESGYKNNVLAVAYQAKNNETGAYNTAKEFCIKFERPADKETKGKQRGEDAKVLFREFEPNKVEANSKIASSYLNYQTGVSDTEDSSSDTSLVGQMANKLGEMVASPYVGVINDFFGRSKSDSSGGYNDSYSGNANATSAKDWFASTLTGSSVTSDYGMRMHPIEKKMKMHRGIDFSASAGTPIYSPVSGTVNRVGYGNSYGNFVRITDRSGGEHVFAHMKELSKLKEGQSISKGDQVGIVGSTGNSTGNHLHYQTNQSPSGESVNPDQYLASYKGGGTRMKSPLTKKNKELAIGGGDDSGSNDKLIEAIISILVQMNEDTSNLVTIKELLYTYFNSEPKSGKGSAISEKDTKKSKARENIVNIINSGSNDGPSDYANNNSRKEMLLKQLKMLMSD